MKRILTTAGVAVLLTLIAMSITIAITEPVGAVTSPLCTCDGTTTTTVPATTTTTTAPPVTTTTVKAPVPTTTVPAVVTPTTVAPTPGQVRPTPAAPVSTTLPFTGVNPWPYLVTGLVLVSLGVLLLRRKRAAR